MSSTMLSDESAVALFDADIGGTHGETGWMSMAEFERIYARVELGVWTPPDALTTCKLEQAQTSGGAGAKDLTTSGPGLGYDTDHALNASWGWCVLEARAQDLDAANGYTWVRVYVAATANTGVDIAHGVLMLYGARYHYAQRELSGYVPAGAQYVTPD